MSTIGEKADHVRAAIAEDRPTSHHCHWPGCHEAVPPTIDAPERREAVARLIDPRAWLSNSYGFQLWRTAAIAKADAILALLAASSGEREKALEEATRAIEAKRREWFCSGADCSNFDHGRDEGFEMALHIIRALATPATVEEPKV